MIEVMKNLGTGIKNNLATESFLILEHRNVSEAVGSSSYITVTVDELSLLISFRFNNLTVNDSSG